jgi:hypothetical protein
VGPRRPVTFRPTRGRVYRQRYMMELLFTVGLIAVGLVMVLLLVSSFMFAVARVLRKVSPENRRMEPGQVWLNLVPIFNIVWATVTVERVAESLRNEFRERGMDGPEERYGRGRGLTAITLLLMVIPPQLALVTWPLACGYAIAYWRQLNRYAERLRPGAYSPPPTDEGW